MKVGALDIPDPLPERGKVPAGWIISGKRGVMFMPSRIEDYALIGNCRGAALVARDGSIEAIERHLMRDGFVDRYTTEPGVDGLPSGEGAFLACTFWLADCQHLLGRHADARQTFERLLALRNDVGLLSEEYDRSARRLVGNFPQAFSHIGLVNTAMNLSPAAASPAKQRTEASEPTT